MLEAALTHLRITDGAETPVLQQYLAAACEAFERLTGRCTLTQIFELSVSEWPKNGKLSLGRAPVNAIHSVSYADEDDVNTDVEAATYALVQPEDASGELHLRDAFTWPTPSDAPDAIKVQFEAGFSDWASVPATQKQAILYLTAHFYELRTPINVGNIVNEVPLTFTALLNLNRIGGFVG